MFIWSLVYNQFYQTFDSVKLISIYGKKEKKEKKRESYSNMHEHTWLYQQIHKLDQSNECLHLKQNNNTTLIIFSFNYLIIANKKLKEKKKTKKGRRPSMEHYFVSFNMEETFVN